MFWYINLFIWNAIFISFIKCDKDAKLNKFPEFKYISTQHLLLLSPSEQCGCNQKTIFFKYPDFIEQKNDNLNITELNITDKEYFVGIVQRVTQNLKSKKSYESLKLTLQNNNIIRLFHIDDTNLYWRTGANRMFIPNNFSKYQKFNGMLMGYTLSRKDMLYRNYEIMKEKFPNDFTYMPETYTQYNMDTFKRKFKNYQVSEDDLWLVKPEYSGGGYGIYFLKNVNEVKNNNLVTKYIANPLLINNKKFDLRLYVLVTGHDPLKIYLFNEGLVRLSTEDYDLNLNDLDNKYKHLTNTSINKKNKKKKNKRYKRNNNNRYNSLTLSISEARKYLEKNYHIKFPLIWKQIKDIIIKTILSMNHLELEKEKDYNLHKNNLFEFYGVDIMIDTNFKPWLLEMNCNPSLNYIKKEIHNKILKHQLVHDLFNIIGLIPYSHIDGHALEGECHYQNSVEESIDLSICEFTRPLGGFELIFPLKDNIKYYKKFFVNISQNNQALWDKVEKGEIINNKNDIMTDNNSKEKSFNSTINMNLQRHNEILKIQNESSNEILSLNINRKNEKTIKSRFPPFKKVKYQNLSMVLPSSMCKIKQRTIFFKYPSFLESNINDKVENLLIKNKEYYVGSVQRFKHKISSKTIPNSLKRTLNDNGIIRLYKEDDVNLYWRNTRENSIIPSEINKYQKYNHMLMFHEITRKHLLYKNYEIFRKKFLNHFNYIPETYTQENIDQFYELFKDYKISKDNLWLIKPQNSSLGKGIRFLKSIKDVKKDDIVTKYISDPLLINGRKFDLRFHVLVTGHNPLKIYMHTNGWAKISSELYDLDLKNINNLYKHVTNIGLNKKNKKKYNPEEFILSFEKVKNYLKTDYNLKFSDIFEEVKDIVIKSLITMNHLEIEEEKNYNLKSNNIFDLYGVDIIIDSKFKAWLVEINISPTLFDESLTLDRKKMLHQTLNDALNIIGMKPYSHINGTALESDMEFNDSIEEAIQESICEFTRPLGGFEHIFPLKNNIDYYKNFFKNISQNNQALWDDIQKKNSDDKIKIF